MADVKLFNDIFSDCDRSYKAVEPDGLRVGYPTNFWKDIGHEVRTHHHTLMPLSLTPTNFATLCFAQHAAVDAQQWMVALCALVRGEPG